MHNKGERAIEERAMVTNVYRHLYQALASHDLPERDRSHVFFADSAKMQAG
jgi:hypothetical protein